MTDPREILIDASNLHVGGGVQVASSFISELDEIAALNRSNRPWLRNVVVHASTPVLENVGRPVLHIRCLQRDTSPRKQMLASLTRRSSCAITFTIFGPTYQLRRHAVTIAGFADGTSLRPGRRTVRSLLRQRLSRRFFTQQVDTVVVEASQVADDVSRAWGIDPARIRVVPNVLNKTVRDHPPIEPTATPSRPFVLGYPTRFYPHKNLTVLGRAAQHLHEVAHVDVRFLLTLTPEEWTHLDPLTKKYSTTVGSVPTKDLPAFYSRCHAVVFPSLNESFSATPLEAHHFRLPLVASDRGFVRSISKDTAFYFEPTDHVDVAHAIHDVMRLPPQALSDQLDRARALVDDWTTARERAEMYLDLIEEHLQGQPRSL